MSEIFLLPGRIGTIKGQGIIRTVLGSCVAVVLYDPVKLIGGVNHFLLPNPLGGMDQQPRLKYGIYAIPDLLEELLVMGAGGSRLSAEIYGGAAVIDQLLGNFSIGDRNIATAESCLAQLSIPIRYRDVGGQNGRKIIFQLPSCRTEVKSIRSTIPGS